MNKKGFTLIEIIAVVIILTIILLITMPMILNMLTNVERNTLESSAYGLIQVAENDCLVANLEKIPEYQEIIISNGEIIQGEIEFAGQKPQNANIHIDQDCRVALKIETENWCLTKKYNENEITVIPNEEECILDLFAYVGGQPYPPMLIDGMIPVYWDEANQYWAKADAMNFNNEWYNYEEKQWANAITVTSASRAGYLASSPGTEINMNHILTFFVWIPRYRYAIPYGVGPRTISIIFESIDTPKTTGTAKGNDYLTHPAFTFGDDELNGFWVGKFTTTGSLANITIKPNSAMIRSQSYSAKFNATRNMQNSGNAYGFPENNADLHMMKNTEWGAVVMITNSDYGKNAQIWRNPSSSYLTGCAGASASPSGVSGCPFEYHTNNGMQASTTGNITGIYDMSGGGREGVMGNFNNLASASGFDMNTLDSKYYDLYTDNNGIIGDATNADGDINNWYDDHGSFVNDSLPWFHRGGFWNYHGTPITYNRDNAMPSIWVTYRIVAAPIP